MITFVADNQFVIGNLQIGQQGSKRLLFPAMPSYTMGSTEKLQPRTWEALQNLKSGQILIFTIHGIPDPVHDAYSTSIEVFTKYLEYMRDHHFKVIAVRDLHQYINHDDFTLFSFQTWVNLEIPYPLTMRFRAPQSTDLLKQVEKMKLIIKDLIWSKCSGIICLTFRNEVSIVPESPPVHSIMT